MSASLAVGGRTCASPSGGRRARSSSRRAARRALAMGSDWRRRGRSCWSRYSARVPKMVKKCFQCFWSEPKTRVFECFGVSLCILGGQNVVQCFWSDPQKKVSLSAFLRFCVLFLPSRLGHLKARDRRGCQASNASKVPTRHTHEEEEAKPEEARATRRVFARQSRRHLALHTAQRRTQKTELGQSTRFSHRKIHCSRPLLCSSLVFSNVRRQSSTIVS